MRQTLHLLLSYAQTREMILKRELLSSCGMSIKNRKFENNKRSNLKQWLPHGEIGCTVGQFDMKGERCKWKQGQHLNTENSNFCNFQIKLCCSLPFLSILYFIRQANRSEKIRILISVAAFFCRFNKSKNDCTWGASEFKLAGAAPVTDFTLFICDVTELF